MNIIILLIGLNGNNKQSTKDNNMNPQNKILWRYMLITTITVFVLLKIMPSILNQCINLKEHSSKLYFLDALLTFMVSYQSMLSLLNMYANHNSIDYWYRNF